MSFQQPQQQQQQQQQPVLVYPNTVTKQPDSSSHSNGSFGAVFIVLAVIVVLSAIACFLGRLCSRRFHHPKPKQNQSKKQRASLPKLEREPRQKNNFRGGEFEDIEFGFDKGVNPMASAKAKGSRDSRPPNKRGDQIHGEPRFAYGEEGDLKAAAQFSAA